MDNLQVQNTLCDAEAGEQTLLVTQLERCAVHDGPGIRTVVFLQGCPLRCDWCCNPETQPARPVLLHDGALCVHCGACAAVCPTGAASLKNGRATFDRAVCRRCGACVQHCPVGALALSGHTMTVSEILARVRRDEAFYAETGGGMTLSGGEPLLQGNVVTLLRQAKAAGLSTAVETTACIDRKRLLEAAPYVDRFYIDYKHPDADTLYAATGARLAQLEENVRALIAAGANVTLRTPVIPGFNDSAEIIGRCFAFARAMGIAAYVLLPYHALGRKKYDKLDRPYYLGDAPVLCAADLEPLRVLGEQTGLSVTIGG